MFLWYKNLTDALLKMLVSMPDQSIRRSQDLLCYGETWIRVRRLPGGGLLAERVPPLTNQKEEKSDTEKQPCSFIEYKPNLN